MDVARPPQKKTGRNIGIGVAVLAVVVTTIAVARLKPAAPTVDLSVSIQDSVRQGDMIREMRGPGTLVPEQIQQSPRAATARGRPVDVVAGQTVNAGDMLLETSSPDVEISTMNADQQLNQAQVEPALAAQHPQEQRTVAAGAGREHAHAIHRRNAGCAAADTLFKQHLIAQFDVTNKHALADRTDFASASSSSSGSRSCSSPSIPDRRREHQH